MTNLDIYFSDACNSNCQYCPIQNNNNEAIRQALEDNTFVTNVRHTLTPETESIGFYGREPSVNGEYFSKFICNLLDYSPYIKYIGIVTNGQSNTFYQDFIVPLYIYCNIHKRKIILIIQFTLDGPPDLQDKYRGEGSTQKCINNIDYIFNNFNFNNKYLRLQTSTKSTLRGYEIENYSTKQWTKYMLDIRQRQINKVIITNDCKIGELSLTVEVPGNYTAAQGQALKRWERYFTIDQFSPCFNNNFNKTIDYLGNIYDCHLLVNKNITQEQLRAQFETTMDTLVSQGEAIEQNRDKLFNTILSIYCWGAEDKTFDNYIRLLGNGFLL